MKRKYLLTLQENSFIDNWIRSIRLTLGSIYFFYKEVKIVLYNICIRNQRIINATSDYLIEGTYVSLAYGDRIVNACSNVKNEIITFRSLDSKSQLILPLYKCFCKLIKYKVSNTGEKFKGVEIIISSSGNEYKIFKEGYMEVLTVFGNPNKLNTIISNRQVFEQYFFVPKMLHYNIEEGYCIEQYINHTCFEMNKCIDSLLDNYKAYFYSTSCKFTIEIDNNKPECQYFKKKYGNSKMLEEIQTLPKAFVHGDLWESNILFNGVQYYLTDFELAGRRYFLYDFFCFIYSPYMIKGDGRLIEDYLLGRFDLKLGQLPKIGLFKYDPSNRGVFLLAFIVSINYERWMGLRVEEDKVLKSLHMYIPEYFDNK